MAGCSDSRWASQIGCPAFLPPRLSSSRAGEGFHSTGTQPLRWRWGRVLRFPSDAGEITGPFNLQNPCPECVQEAWSCHERVPRVCLSLRPAFPHGPKLGSGHHVPNSSPPPTPLILPLFFLPLSLWLHSTLPLVLPSGGHGSGGKGHLVSGPCFWDGLCLLPLPPLAFLLLYFPLKKISSKLFCSPLPSPCSPSSLNHSPHPPSLSSWSLSPPCFLHFLTSVPCHGVCQLSFLWYLWQEPYKAFLP